MQNLLLQAAGDGVQGLLGGNATGVINQLAPEIPHTSFITDLAIIMIVGSTVTMAFFKIKQPLIIGYLFAGMLIGPLSPLWSLLLPGGVAPADPGTGVGIGLLSDISALNLFAELGVILLMFVIGIEFPYAKIRSIGKVAVGVGTIGLFATLGAVFLVSTAMGLTFMDSLFLAAAMSISSTAVIVKILTDMGKIKKESSILVLGILIVEDVIAVILISSLQSIALVGTLSIDGVLVVVIVAAGLIIGTFTVGKMAIPPIIDKVAAAEHREILLLAILGVCFGYALLANVVGLSVAIGAFLAGVLVAESKSSEVSKLLASPIKDMFVAVFFISVGALMDVSQLEDYIILAVVLIVVAGTMKLGGNFLANTLFRQKRENAIRSAFTLAAPRGEFSIVIVKAGVDLGAVSSFLFPLIGMISIVTAFISPFLIKTGERVVTKVSSD
jgi:CPA2 family monovalent cation:H+ antiporter-2